MRDPGRRARRRRPAGDEGITLVELMVSTVVFTVAITLVYNALILVQRQVGDLEGSAEAASQVRQGLAQIDRQVRSGNVLYSPAGETQPASCRSVGSHGGTCMRVYTQANGAERCVQWQVMADPAAPGSELLRVRSWQPSGAAAPAGSAWQTVARGLVPAAAEPPFRLVADSAWGARLLRVHLEARDPRRGDAPVVLTSSLSGRNTHYGLDAGQCAPVPTG